jgi:O-antigen ligase/tetratricopeptide (TPR) repeat protein
LISYILLLTALVLAPIIGGRFDDFANGIIEALVFGGIILHTSLSRSRGRIWVRPTGFWPLLVFWIIVCVSAAFSSSIYAGIRQVLFLSACIGAYTLSTSLCKDAKIAAVVAWAILMPAMGICVVAIRNYAIAAGGGIHFWQSILGPGTHDRLFGTFVNPGFFAGYLVLTLPITMGIYLVTRKFVLALLAGIAVVTQTVALMLTGTKFGIVSAVIALLVLFVLAIATRSLRRSRFERLIIIAAILTPVLVVFSGPVTSRIGEAEAGGSQVHSTTFRVFTWEATARMISHNPWLGVGAGMFEYAYPRYTIAGPTKNAHQGYLQIAAESGLIALGAFAFALICVAYRALDGIFKGLKNATVPTGEPTIGPGISWKDLVPFSGWRIMNCAMFAALAGCAVRNLADSDWFVLGIALPFGIVTGMLMAQTDATQREVVVENRLVRIALIVLCVLMSLFAISFALGDLVAPDSKIQSSMSSAEMLRRYRLASMLSPLNPEYHREAAKYLAAEGNTREALRELKTAIRLASTDASNYYTMGLVSQYTGRTEQAVEYYEKSLRYNPKSTGTLLKLAEARLMLGDTHGAEEVFNRMIWLEESEYEKIKGVPELVDTNFVYAHVYFADKYLTQKRYARAITELTEAIDRLERWRSNKEALKIARFSGMLTPKDERNLLLLLRACYFRLAHAYEALGESKKAAEASKTGKMINPTPTHDRQIR